VLDIIEEEKLLSRSYAIGARVCARIEGWRSRNDLITTSEPRGLGGMVGFDVIDAADKKPLANGGKLVSSRALDAGVVVLSCGAIGETVRILVPLTASDEIVDEGLDAIETALSAVS
ncbi:MAG TPA: aminotransferase class III-fold pyridoxal phosphate-dependent enzyme, partial [Sphingomonadaceae bacterium]|nr:aminotransferase class III-fold pyridoxal phosphate-dependent enzyme [Sphingomonadaceae bacterium]